MYFESDLKGRNLLLNAGSHGGQPLHLAAKLGLERTVFLLLSRGGTSSLSHLSTDDCSDDLRNQHT